MKSCVIIALLLCSLTARAAADEEIHAIRITGADSGNGHDKTEWEVTTGFTDAANEEALVQAAIANQKHSDSIDIVILGEGEPALEPVNEVAKGHPYLKLTNSFGVRRGSLVPPPLAHVGAKIAKPFENAGLFYVNQIRPKLPLSPMTPTDTKKLALTLTAIKGVLGAGATASLLFLRRDQMEMTEEFIRSGLAMTAFQTAIALATAVRNTETQEWVNDKNYIWASGIKETGKFAGIKRDAKFFGLMAILLAATNAEAGLLGLKPSVIDLQSTLWGAGLSTVIAKGWYASLGTHIPKSSPWYHAIPVIMFGAATVGNVSAALQGTPMNEISMLSWGGLGVGGLVTYYTVSKQGLSGFFQDVKSAMTGVVNTCSQVLQRVGL